MRFYRKKHGRRILRTVVSAALSITMVIGSGTAAFAESAQDPTPTPNPHSAYYDLPAETSALNGWPEAPSIEAEAAIVMDIETGAVLYSKDADTQHYPASITKIMTGYLASRSLYQGTEFAMFQSAAFGIEPGSSSIYADTDEEFTVEQAMMALMLESANEMALQLAMMTSGSVKKFAELMNRTARSLGCTGTHFNNPHGLPDTHHYITARDMAVISSAAWKNPVFRMYTTTRYYEIPPTNIQPETRYMLNHHKMIAGNDRAYEGVLGGKTGYTTAAGSTLVTYAERNGMQLVVVVLNGTDGCYSDTAALLDYAFDNFTHLDLKLQRDTRTLLPCQQMLIDDTDLFQFTEQVCVTVPKGFTADQIERSRTLVRNQVGNPTMKNVFTYGGNTVGVYSQTLTTVLQNFVLNTDTE